MHRAFMSKSVSSAYAQTKRTAVGAVIQEITRVSAAAHAAYPAQHGPAPAARVREVVLHQPKSSLPSRRPRAAAGSSQAERASQQASCVRSSLRAPWFTGGYAYVPVLSSFPPLSHKRLLHDGGACTKRARPNPFAAHTPRQKGQPSAP